MLFIIIFLTESHFNNFTLTNLTKSWNHNVREKQDYILWLYLFAETITESWRKSSPVTYIFLKDYKTHNTRLQRRLSKLINDFSNYFAGSFHVFGIFVQALRLFSSLIYSWIWVKYSREFGSIAIKMLSILCRRAISYNDVLKYASVRIECNTQYKTSIRGVEIERDFFLIFFLTFNKNKNDVRRQKIDEINQDHPRWKVILL